MTSLLVEFTAGEGVRLITRPTPSNVLLRATSDVDGARYVGAFRFHASLLEGWRASAANELSRAASVVAECGIFSEGADVAMREVQTHFRGFVAGVEIGAAS